MDLEYSTKETGMLNILFEGSCEQAVDCDVSLPDYCPDISRVLKCCVIPSITSAKISGDRACADGNALVRIIYADESNYICTYEQNFPFSKFIQLGGDISGALNTSVQVQYTNCRAVSKRRVDIHSLLNILFKIFSVSRCASVTEIGRKTVQTKVQEVCFSNLLGTESKVISLSETVELPSGYPPAERVISCCTVPIVNDVRIVQDKILIKGEAAVTFNYCTSESNEESISFNHSIPINQVIEVPLITENSVASVRLKNLGCECNVRNDMSSIPRLIELNCNILASIKAYSEDHISCITDAYCIEGTLQPEYERRDFLNLCNKVHESCVHKFTVDLSSGDIQKICCIWWDSVKVNKTLLDGNLGLHCCVPLNILAIDSDSRPVFCEREVDFEFRKEVDGNACQVTDESVIPLGFSRGSISDGKAEIKGEFLIDADIFSLQSVNTLVKADIASSEGKQPTCIIVYFPDKDESLWNIARKFNTTVEMIKEQNTIADDFLQNGDPLLIPVAGN